MSKEPIVYLNGQFVKLSEARVSVLDRGFNYGDGLFETMRSYAGKIFRLDLHMIRLIDSARQIHLELPVTEQEMRSALMETLKGNGYPDSYLRMTVTRGNSSPGLGWDDTSKPTMVILNKPLEPTPDEWHREGIPVGLFPSSAVRTGGTETKIKSCNFLSNIMIREQARKNNFLEGIMMDDSGYITEGTTSNIFAVHDGTLLTPALNEFILPGVTRAVVLEIARHCGMAYKEKPMKKKDIYQADEVFLTNSVVEILPVSRVEDHSINGGKPGPLTQFLHQQYLKLIEGEN